MFNILTQFAVGEQNVLLQYGIAGVAILGLTATVIRLYLDNQKLQSQVCSLQTARLDDAKESIEKITVPMNGISTSIKLITDKIITGKQEAL